MAGIFKDGNVYVYIDKHSKNKIKDNGVCIIDSDPYSGRTRTLFGGRVKMVIDGSVVSISIDGIDIIDFYADHGVHSFYKMHSFGKITAFLNQIENLGVDSFLENYKLQLQQIKLEFESYADGIQQELAINYDEKKAEKLSNYKEFILTLGCVIFALLINMNAGLQNQDYINAYDNIINTYF